MRGGSLYIRHSLPRGTLLLANCEGLYVYSAVERVCTVRYIHPSGATLHLLQWWYAPKRSQWVKERIIIFSLFFIIIIIMWIRGLCYYYHSSVSKNNNNNCCHHSTSEGLTDIYEREWKSQGHSILGSARGGVAKGCRPTREREKRIFVKLECPSSNAFKRLNKAKRLSTNMYKPRAPLINIII